MSSASVEMYVATFSVQEAATLIRVDVVSHVSPCGIANIATYTFTDRAGAVSTTQTTLGPDSNGVGLPIMAATEMLRDLYFCGEAQDVALVQGTELFDQSALDLVLDCSGVAHALLALTTSPSIQ